MYIRQHDQICRYGQLAHKQHHLLYMDSLEGAGVQEACKLDLQVPKKRFCCGAAKRLKDKCLRFHQNEEKCIDFIKGHQECVIVKRQFEGSQQTGIN